MLVYEILLSVAVKDYRVAVKAFDHALKLKAVGKIYCYRNLVFACLIKKNVLKINVFVHSKLLFPADLSVYCPLESAAETSAEIYVRGAGGILYKSCNKKRQKIVKL